MPILPRTPLRVYYPFQFGLAFGLRQGDHTPCRVADFLVVGKTFLVDGKTPSRITVLHTPGHTPGHLAFWLEEEGVLLSGDAIVTWPAFMGGWDSFTLNQRKHRKSLRTMAGVPGLRVVGVGHGEPITANAAELVKSLGD